MRPAATWYEKDDLNTTDMHSFINPMQAAVRPSWESRSDWGIFGAIAKSVSAMAPQYFPEPVEDVIMLPLQHDTVDEISQPVEKDWWTGECEAIPGKTMPKFKVVTRDFSKIAEKWGALGPAMRTNGVAAHGLQVPVEEFYDELARRRPTFLEVDGEELMLPSLEIDRDVCETILALDPASNGELAFRAFEAEERKTGLELTHLAEGSRDVRINFAAIVGQPQRILTTPTWSGKVAKGRAYSPFTLNVEDLVPWRTLTGRQHFYLDHDNYLKWGEHLPVYKPRPTAARPPCACAMCLTMASPSPVPPSCRLRALSTR